MIYYNDFINEAKIDEIKEGDYVVCDKDFRNVSGCEGKLAQVEKITSIERNGVVVETYYTFKIIKPDIPEDKIQKSDYLVFTNWAQKDNFTISKGQVSRSITKLTEEEANSLRKGYLIKFECRRNLERILKDMKFRIKKNYIDSSFYNVDSEKDDLVSYIPANKYKTEIKSKYQQGYQGIKPYEVSFRQTIKVGKFLKKLNPELKDAQLEKFVNSYKASWNKHIKSALDRLQIVTGEDIRDWYHQKNYGSDSRGNQGTLGNSCMKYARCQRRFDIYCDNPDKCAMAIYVNDLGELMARALIWKLDNGIVFMDRIYYVDYASEQMLHDYAIEKKMQTYKGIYAERNDMTIKLNRNYGSATSNPYMDTMRYFNYKTNTLVNSFFYEKLDWDKKQKYNQYMSFI